MIKSRSVVSLLIIALIIVSLSGQVIAQAETQETFSRHSIGSSPFSLFNFEEDGPDFYILNYGYRLTEKSVIIVEAWTWRYAEPMGSYGDSEKMYPGWIRSYGIGAGYQHYLWKNLFAAVEATPLILQYFDEDDSKIQKGFQLYCQLMAGYHFELFDGPWYIEPAVSMKYWPVNTNVPESFTDIDDGTPGTILEPGLILGYRF